MTRRFPAAVSEYVSPGLEALKVRNLRWLWTGQVVSQIGDGLNRVALLWLVYMLTESTLKMSEVGVFQTLPPMLLGPLMGVYVDRFSKKPLMMAVDLVRALLSVVIPILYVLGEFSLVRLYVVVFLIGLVTTAFTPALSSTVPLIVERRQLTAANALIHSTAMVGMFVGPAVGGIGIATIGAVNMLYVNGGTFLLSVLCLSRLHIPPCKAEDRAPRPTTTVYKELRAGLHFVFVKRRTILGFVAGAFVYSLAAGAFVFLLPVYADDVLGSGPVLLGWLWAAYGAGMVVVTAGLAFSKQRPAPVRLYLVTGLMAVGSAASFALSRVSFPVLALLFVAVVGISVASFTPVAWSTLQELTPPDLRGRIFAIFNTGAMSSSIVGMVAFGWAADTLGPRVSLSGMAAVLLVTGLITAALSRRRDVRAKPQQTDPGDRFGG